MKRLFTGVIIILLGFIAVPMFRNLGNPVYSSNDAISAAQVSNDELQDQLKQLDEQLALLNQQIDEVNSAIAAEEGKQSDLSNDINYLSNLITQTELDIKKKELDIKKKETQVKILERDLNDLEIQIASLEFSIKELEDTANEIVNSIYIETKSSSFIDLLLSSDKSTDFIASVAYHTSLAETDQNALEELIAKRDDLQKYKETVEENSKEQQKIAYAIKLQKDDLELTKEILTQQQLDKTQLLNNSYLAVDNYQGQLGQLSDEQQQANAERNLVLQQIQQNIGVIDGEFVLKGQWIAKQGATGCVTGAHGHIMILRDNVIQNPCSVFPFTPENGNNFCGTNNPEFDWPMRSDQQWFVTGSYNYPVHQAVDAAYASGTSGQFFVAPFNGYLIRRSDPCDVSWCNETTLGVPGVTCNTPAANAAILCENQDCSKGWQIGIWHVE